MDKIEQFACSWLFGSLFGILFTGMNERRISLIIIPLVLYAGLLLFSKKKRVKEDIFYYKNINKFYSREKYADYLYDLPRNERKVSDAYAHQIYSLANTILPFKFKMIKISGWMLTFSILLSILTYFAMSLF